MTCCCWCQRVPSVSGRMQPSLTDWLALSLALAIVAWQTKPNDRARTRLPSSTSEAVKAETLSLLNERSLTRLVSSRSRSKSQPPAPPALMVDTLWLTNLINRRLLPAGAAAAASARAVDFQVEQSKEDEEEAEQSVPALKCHKTKPICCRKLCKVRRRGSGSTSGRRRRLRRCQTNEY